VGTVETGEHEERRAVDARTQGQAQFVVGVHVFLGLQGKEAAAQQHSDRQPDFQRAAMALLQGMVGDGDGHTGADQQNRVDQRQAPRADDFFGRREQFRVRRVQ